MASAKTCPQLDSCPMFRLLTVAGTGEVWKMNYCESTFERCERYKRTQAGESVPLEMMPNGKILKIRSK